MGAISPYFVAEGIRFRGADIIFISGYLINSIGPTGRNLELLYDLTAFLKGMGWPFIVGADWNMEPADLAHTGLLQRLRAHVVTPEGVDYT